MALSRNTMPVWWFPNILLPPILGNEEPWQTTPARMLLLIWLFQTWGLLSNITMPSALSVIVFLMSQQKPTSMQKMPSYREERISLLIITESDAFGPPSAMFAL